MKKSVPAAFYIAVAVVISSFIFYGCAATGATQNASASSTMSVDQILQKSAEVRQQVQDAKTAAKTAQAANNASGASTSTKQAVKDAVNEAVGGTVKQVKDEVDAWKSAVK
ncbi:MAG: hypothetical protein LBG46_00115 [Elusimicrobiota bacterium]|jgi:uncharacterized lipoprotein YajG|nr:hypothetical protein [Elusimicrobiota bacterium]